MGGCVCVCGGGGGGGLLSGILEKSLKNFKKNLKYVLLYILISSEALLRPEFNLLNPALTDWSYSLKSVVFRCLSYKLRKS